MELERAECERLLAGRSPLALKLLGLLNEGLISALRGADRRLMKLEAGEGAGLPDTAAEATVGRADGSLRSREHAARV